MFFLSRNANQRSLQALFIIKGINSMCMCECFFPLAYFQIMVSHRERKEPLRVRGTTQLDPFTSLRHSTSHLLSTILFYLTLRGRHKFYITAHGLHFLSSPPPSILTLPHFPSFYPSAISLHCVTLLGFFLPTTQLSSTSPSQQSSTTSKREVRPLVQRVSDTSCLSQVRQAHACMKV